jgi:prolyl-tRNA editing enzyme YbaK/EbsC (Cys-tRNA(Pro) deacylase)
VSDDRGDDHEIEARVRRVLDGGEAAYDVVACDPGLADTEAFCAAYGYAPADAANTIVVVGKAEPPRYVACVLLATTRLDVNRFVRKRLGTKKASFAAAAPTAELTGMKIGGITPFALPDDLPVWVDARVLDRDRIVLGGGSRACKIVGPPGLLYTIPGLEVVEGLASEPR